VTPKRVGNTPKANRGTDRKDPPGGGEILWGKPREGINFSDNQKNYMGEQGSNLPKPNLVRTEEMALGVTPYGEVAKKSAGGQPVGPRTIQPTKARWKKK